MNRLSQSPRIHHPPKIQPWTIPTHGLNPSTIEFIIILPLRAFFSMASLFFCLMELDRVSAERTASEAEQLRQGYRGVRNAGQFCAPGEPSHGKHGWSMDDLWEIGCAYWLMVVKCFYSVITLVITLWWLFHDNKWWSMLTQCLCDGPIVILQLRWALCAVALMVSL